MNTKKHTTLLNSALAVFITLVSISAMAGQNARLKVLNPPGSIYTTASGVNDNGITVGSFELAGQQLQGFAYLRARDAYESINYPGAVYTTALSVNDSNIVVGTFANGDGVDHGFFLEKGNYRQYDVSGSSGTTIMGINKAGDIAGTVGSNGDYQGFVSVAGVVTTFAVDGQPTEAYGINSQNDSVGFFINKQFSGWHGFLRESSGKTTQIDYPGSLSTACTSINDAGQITGFYTDANDVNHAFVLVNGRFRTLSAPYAAGINNQGVIVGSFTGQKGETYGFIWTR